MRLKAFLLTNVFVEKLNLELLIFLSILELYGKINVSSAKKI